MNDKEIVSALLTGLAERVGRERYDLWFGKHTKLTVQSTGILVEAPNAFYRDWLRNNFRGELETISTRIVGRSLPIEFRIDAGLLKKTKATGPKLATVGSGTETRSDEASEITQNGAVQQNLEFKDPAPSLSGIASNVKTTSENNEKVAKVAFSLHDLNPQSLTAPTPLKPSNVNSSPAINSTTDQQPESNSSFRPRPLSSMQTFVQGKCNRLAAASIMHLVDRPGESNPLFIYGPTGTGKSHLLEASVRDTLNRYPQRKCLYITAEQFTTHFLEALHGRGLPSFHRKIRSYELLAIDDIQFMAGKKVTLMELLSTMDYMLQHGRQLVLSADRPSHELTELSKEITTRLSGGLPLKLEAPDHATRIGIVRHFASKLSLELNDDIQEFISTHFSEHARELAGATHRLYAAWRMQKKPLTLACAEEALAEMIHRNTRGVKLQDIEDAVCKIVGLNPDSLKSDERRKVINTTRMLAMWLARKHTRAALSEIGTYFGRRSHSTVISAQKTVTSWVNEQSQVSLGNRTWNIEEAIRKVEAQLRASG